MRTIRDDDEALLATFGRLLLVVTREAPSAASFAVFRDALRQHLSQLEGKVYVFAVLRAPRPRMDPEVRAMMLALWKECGDRLVFAVWPARSSFAGALQLSFITAVSLLRLSRSPIKVVHGTAAAVDFFGDHDPELAPHREAWIESIDEALAEPASTK